MKEWIEGVLTYIIVGLAIIIPVVLLVFGMAWFDKTSIENTCHTKLTWKQSIFYNSHVGKCVTIQK